MSGASFNPDIVLNEWPSEQALLKQWFIELLDVLRAQEEAELSLVSREGISHSIRGERPGGGRQRPVFTLLDVIVSSTDPWFLSVCFYEDDIKDPDEKGDVVPDGLLGETACCFDLDEDEPDMLPYIKARLQEAYESAAG